MFSIRSPKDAWLWLKDCNITISPINTRIFIEADAWNSNWAASQNKRYGQTEYALYDAIMAPEKMRKHEEAKNKKVGSRFSENNYSVPMDHSDRYNKHSPNRFTDRAIRRFKKERVDYL